MKNLSNRTLVIMFVVSLVLMGMAGLPIALFEDANKPSALVVTGLRLSFVGLLALTTALITGCGKPLIGAVNVRDVKDLLGFFSLAVIGVNGMLTLALYFLADHRMAMAIMLAFIGLVFVVRHWQKPAAWGMVILAIAGAALLATNAVEIAHTGDKNFLYGAICAAIGGTAQGLMFRKRHLLPENINPGLSLGGTFLLGGLVTIVGAAVFVPQDLKQLGDTNTLTSMFLFATLTLPGWLMLGYISHRMSHAEKSGAAAMEPVGAAITQYVRVEYLVASEMLGVILLMLSAYMVKFLAEE